MPTVRKLMHLIAYQIQSHLNIHDCYFGNMFHMTIIITDSHHNVFHLSELTITCVHCVAIYILIYGLIPYGLNHSSDSEPREINFLM